MNYTLIVYYPNTKNTIPYYNKYQYIEEIKLKKDLISNDIDAITVKNGQKYWYFYIDASYYYKNIDKITDLFDNIINKTINLKEYIDICPVYISMNNYTQEYIWINNDLKDKIIDNVNLQLKLKTMFNY
jgi:hypothetical protein